LTESNFDTLFDKGFPVFSQNAVFVAAVSGGADSTAMLIALKHLSDKRNYRVSCLHIRHNIRSAKESEADAEFVRSLCARLEVPLRIVSIKAGKIAQRAAETGSGIEAAAREYRQAAYKHELKRLGAAKVVVAHNQDDALENTLMRILRGSGPKGLAFLPQSTKLILRPMIHISRRQILDYLAKHNQSYQVDASNHENIYLRNRVRNILVPVLNEHFPNWIKGVESMGKTQAYIADYLESEAKRLVKWQLCVSIASNGIETDCENFNKLNPIIQEEAVFQGIKQLLNQSSSENEGLHADIPREYKVPRRSVLRSFLHSGGISVNGSEKSLDLGKIRLLRSGASIRGGNGKLQILLWEDPLVHRAAALCAEKTGSYHFMGFSINIDERSDEIDAKADFHCELPIVFRTPLMGEKLSFNKQQKTKTRNIKNGIIIEDRNGKIAFLQQDAYKTNILLFDERKSLGGNAVSVKISALM
jgi:tRNA(Ile)-lysidine synthase